MKTTGWLSLCLVLAVAGCGKPEPSHQGVALSEWMRRLDTSDTQIINEAIAALTAIGPEATGTLVDALRHPDSDVSCASARALIQMHSDRVDAVFEVLDSGTIRQRLCMARALIQENFQPGRAIPVLGEALQEEDGWYVRNRAIKILGDLNEKSVDAVPALVELLQHTDADVRCRAAYALVRIGAGAAGAVSALIKAMQDPDPHVREGAAYALGSIGPAARESIPALQIALEDRYPKVRYRAARALEQVKS